MIGNPRNLRPILSRTTFPNVPFLLTFWLLAFSARPAAADLDVVFVLDTTGSMQAEIQEVGQRVGEIASSLAAARAKERVRFGVVAFRDRGDDYVTRISALEENLEITQRFLASLVAHGGGDGPEDLIAALSAALSEIKWDARPEVERQVFLIGDAPPHLDYAPAPTPDELIARARQQGIVLNTVGCRSLPPEGVAFFRQMAYATEGQYQHIGRVDRAPAGALAAAMTRTVTASSAAEGEAKETLELTRLGRRQTVDGAPLPSGILVRQWVEDGLCEGEAACGLEIHLPAGFGLAATPRAALGQSSLEVELVLEAGDGGVELYVLSTCPPLTLPIHVVFGGR